MDEFQYQNPQEIEIEILLKEKEKLQLHIGKLFCTVEDLKERLMLAGKKYTEAWEIHKKEITRLKESVAGPLIEALEYTHEYLDKGNSSDEDAYDGAVENIISTIAAAKREMAK